MNDNLIRGVRFPICHSRQLVIAVMLPSMNPEDPEIRDSDWGVLPHPYSEMESARVLVFVEGVNKPYDGELHVVRHPTDETLFSTTVIISPLITDNPAKIGQIRTRLSREYQGAIGRAPNEPSQHPYVISVPTRFFDPLPPPVQVCGSGP